MIILCSPNITSARRPGFPILQTLGSGDLAPSMRTTISSKLNTEFRLGWSLGRDRVTVMGAGKGSDTSHGKVTTALFCEQCGISFGHCVVYSPQGGVINVM